MRSHEYSPSSVCSTAARLLLSALLPALPLASKAGGNGSVDGGDQKEPAHVAGVIAAVSDQWVVLKNVDGDQTINGVSTVRGVRVPAQKVVSVEFDRVLPGH